jgi:hypothetical protein
MKAQMYGLLVLALTSGCYLRPGSVNNPRPSPEGVAVTLIGQDCEDHRGGKGDPVSRDLGIKVRVDNPTDKTLHVTEDAIRLVVDGLSSRVRSPTAVEIQPHGSATVEWDFTHHALCEPQRQFVLAWNDAFVLDDHPVAIADLAFHP